MIEIGVSKKDDRTIAAGIEEPQQWTINRNGGVDFLHGIRIRGVDTSVGDQDPLPQLKIRDEIT
jgi:hypothetical protein